MAKILWLFLFVCVTLQTVQCQFGFFQPQREQNQGSNYFGQGIFEAPNKLREGIRNIFNPNRQRPAVMNQQPATENVYVIEVEDDKQNSGNPVVIVEEQNGGNVNFQQANQNDGFQPNRGNDGFNSNQGNDGFNSNQGNDGFRPAQDGAVNFNNQQNGNGNNGGFQEDKQHDTVPEEPPVPENDAVNFEDSPKKPATTLAPLTPVPVVNTENRNNFNFGTSPVFAETCQTVDGGIGSCISLYDCPMYLKIIQESRTQAMQILRKAHCGFEGNNPKVCCPRPGFPTDTTTTTTTSTTTTEAPQTPGPKTAIDDFIPALPEPPVCGTSNATFSRVVGGVDAKLDDFPWMALLGYKSRRGGTSWLCGGSLISSKHVLTAAHCIHNHENDLYVVRLGELDLAREDEGANPIDVLIKEKIKHEDYSPTAFTNDIAILILDHEVPFTYSIRPICIPKDNELRARSFEDYNPLIAGWGHTEFRGPSATHLQVLQLPVVSNEFCSQAYSQYKSQKIDQRVLCAGFKKGGKDACQGDSGGPLMQPIWSSETSKTYFYQIGVVSYGKKCAEAGFPGVYSRVTHFVPWIEKTVLGHSER